MANRIRIKAGKVVAEAELTDKPTAKKIWEALPIEGRANTWGDEIYFPIPVKAGGEPDARAEMAVGELGYWPPGSAFCIFFGPTPASSGSEPCAASPVNLLGKVMGDATAFKAVKQGEKVVLEKVGG
jgi:hypothetical protein